ncbi:DNA internalization-related competence protein ComEC/Rec2 [Elongatibacter sediminis]|uniref:DNA internalization-related competence protein ComEC/Rec2 n=1 Tax=Elongatibacter sediminis TaxID=3119006 RepID=A0AAW9RHF2_9GAMM
MLLPGWRLPAGFTAGVLGGHLSFWFGVSVVLPSLVLVLIAALGRRVLPAALAIGLCWSEQALESRLDHRLSQALPDREFLIEGRVDALPQTFESHTRFRLRVTDFSTVDSGLDSAVPAAADFPARAGPELLRVYWYRGAPELRPGETWRLRVSLKPPWSEVNFQGADRERWYFAEGIDAVATVRDGVRLDLPLKGAPWHRWRFAVRERLGGLIPQADRRGVVLALAIADRGELTPGDRLSLAATGTAHLLAISGLHVGLAALYGYVLARFLLILLPAGWGTSRLYALCPLLGGLTALAYAALAGFGTSTLRALIMLAVALLALQSRRQLPPGRAWLLALAGVLIIDPLAPLRAGFWLSFAAVGALLFLFAPRRSAAWGFWRSLAAAQTAIMVLMLPLSAWWFQTVSLAGFAANLIAIPWVSAVVVPATLLGLAALPLGDAVAGPVFSLAGMTADWLGVFLTELGRLPFARLDLPQPGLLAVLAGVTGALLLMAPRGLPGRRTGVLWMLPLLIALPAPPPGAARLEVLDTGQGSAVVLTAHERVLLYDAGPGNGRGFDRVDAVIGPAIRAQRAGPPDRIIVSHGDMDHAGGLERLLQRYPHSPVHARLKFGRDGVGRCDDRLAWSWETVDFRVLHPGRWLPYLGNDASCVVSVRAPGWSVLLPGDISAAVERRLVDNGLRQHDVLLVPHHGSASSSSPYLLDTVRSRVAPVTAGPGNRFGFPRTEVRRRFRERGVPLWSTGNCGALRIEVSAGGEIRAQSARRARAAPWRWPAAETCP